VQNERLYRLQALIDSRAAAFLRSRVGLTVDVLFERMGREPGQIVGRSPWLMPVHVDAPASLLGEIAPVTLTATGTNGLFGALASSDSARRPSLANGAPAVEMAS
jgi:tRNA-2-methylthio-N6-dimethylallyladenosine synthase